MRRREQLAKKKPMPPHSYRKPWRKWATWVAGSRRCNLAERMGKAAARSQRLGQGFGPPACPSPYPYAVRCCHSFQFGQVLLGLRIHPSFCPIASPSLYFSKHTSPHETLNRFTPRDCCWFILCPMPGGVFQFPFSLFIPSTLPLPSASCNAHS